MKNRFSKIISTIFMSGSFMLLSACDNPENTATSAQSESKVNAEIAENHKDTPTKVETQPKDEAAIEVVAPNKTENDNSEANQTGNMPTDQSSSTTLNNAEAKTQENAQLVSQSSTLNIQDEQKADNSQEKMPKTSGKSQGKKAKSTPRNSYLAEQQAILAELQNQYRQVQCPANGQFSSDSFCRLEEQRLNQEIEKVKQIIEINR